MSQLSKGHIKETPLEINVEDVSLQGILAIPPGAKGLVILSQGSGSSRFHPLTQELSTILRDKKLATLLLDLLTSEEGEIDQETKHLRFDIDFLADRLGEATDWIATYEETKQFKVGYLGKSTGAAAALMVAADFGKKIKAVVSLGGRPDLAGSALSLVESPTLLIVGALEAHEVELNQHAYHYIKAAKQIEIVQDATYTFEEPGALVKAGNLASSWLFRHLQ